MTIGNWAIRNPINQPKIEWDISNLPVEDAFLIEINAVAPISNEHHTERKE